MFEWAMEDPTAQKSFQLLYFTIIRWGKSSGLRNELGRIYGLFSQLFQQT